MYSSVLNIAGNCPKPPGLEKGYRPPGACIMEAGFTLVQTGILRTKFMEKSITFTGSKEIKPKTKASGS